MHSGQMHKRLLAKKELQLSAKERPKAFGSRTLLKAPKNWEKEALAIIFGIKKFYQYTVSTVNIFS